VYRAPDQNFNFRYEDSITSTVWHSDVSYELQPPGLTTFFLLAQPRTGGDTLFTSQVQTLQRLSPTFVAFLRTLKAVHSGHEQAEFSRRGNRGGIVRREPVENVHPLVRRHPVTGEEALYVNRQFTRRIVGLKREESGQPRPRCAHPEFVLTAVQRTCSASCTTTSTRAATSRRASSGSRAPLSSGTTASPRTRRSSTTKSRASAAMAPASRPRRSGPSRRSMGSS
jgi:hypothetical protein